MNTPSLPPRRLARTAHPIAPLTWRVDPSIQHSPHASDILHRAISAGADWFFLPAELPPDALAHFRLLLSTLPLPPTLVLGIGAEQLIARKANYLADRLTILGADSCIAAMLQDASSGHIKSGTPFHRLLQWRDRGLLRYVFLEAEDCALAEWMAENTPAHALSAPFGLLDQTPAYRLFSAAADAGMALLARPVSQAAWTPPAPVADPLDLAFVLAQPAIASAVRVLPADALELDRILHAAAHPMPPEEQDRWQALFRQSVPPPPPPARSLPPEFGA